MHRRVAPPILALVLTAAPLLALEPIYAKRGLAIAGYDVVAYFTRGRPVKGSAEHSYSWNGAEWRFATAAHRTAFVKDPRRYAPQYGGYCAWGMSRGYAVKVDPAAWTISGGRLYLNYDRDVAAEWEKDIPGHVRRADANWARMLAGE